jgi:hypothetical protein
MYICTDVFVISSSHHLIISSALISSSSHHLIISSSHHLIISSSHHLIISSSHHLIISSSHQLISSSAHQLISSSSHHAHHPPVALQVMREVDNVCFPRNGRGQRDRAGVSVLEIRTPSNSMSLQLSFSRFYLYGVGANFGPSELRV